MANEKYALLDTDFISKMHLIIAKNLKNENKGEVMSEISLNSISSIELNTNIPTAKNRKIIYEIMHMEECVATLSSGGIAKINMQRFMPYDLYLEEDTEIDVLLNNLNNFYHWCASRVLSLDRKYAKEILNSIGVAQAVTDRDRANISLSYHAVSLTDVYWVRKQGENISYKEINLYDNPLNSAVVELTLKGRQMTVTNKELAPDLSTKGCFPKAWIRGEKGFKLLKDGGEDAVRRELLASKICQCFDVPQVKYTQAFYDGQMVSESEIITSKERSMISKFAFDIYAVNNDMNTIEVCTHLDPITFFGMNILDYLTGNTDRHPENWGFWIDNATNEYISLYPIMDFNQCFLAYDTIDGANCQTLYPRRITQREAAIEAVKKIGLRQKSEMEMDAFGNMSEEAEMFIRRLQELKKYA